MNYYELLNIARDADAVAIKRAYFSAVKLHSPDSDPEGFKAVRTAYETLSNSQKRAEYDAYFSVSDEIQNELLTARELIRENKLKQAMEFLTGLSENNPDSMDVKRLLAETLWLMNKSGAAETICKELLKKDPADCDTLLLRAKIAVSGDQIKKAGNFLNKAVAAAPHNSRAWIRYMNHAMEYDQKRISDIFERAMAISPDLFLDEYRLYLVGACELTLSPPKKLFPSENPLKYYEKFTELFCNDKNPDKIIFLTAMTVISNIVEKNEFIPFINKILPILENSRHRRDEDEVEFKNIRTTITLNQLRSDKRIHDILVDLTWLLLDDDGDKNEKLGMECYIVFNLAVLRPSIKILRNEYPECFKLNQTFYLDVLNEKKADFLTDKYLAIYKKLKPLINDAPDDEEPYDDFDVIEESKPFVRDTPKIGRNDPCPCGSGKKYKKCCG